MQAERLYTWCSSLFLMSGLVMTALPVTAETPPQRLQVWPLPSSQQVGLSAPYVPTPQSVVEAMLRLAQVTATDLVYDLGCGDGRIVITAAQKYGAQGVGIDLDPKLVRKSQANAEKAGVSDRVQFRQQDLFQTDLRQATVVTLYLLTTVNQQLRPKLLAELRPGTRVVSHAFNMGEWEPDQVERVATEQGGKRIIYYWVIPAQVAGTWEGTLKTPAGEQPYRFQLEQNFQKVRGTGQLQGQAVQISEGRLLGRQLRLNLMTKMQGQPVTLEFKGQIEGNTLTGTTQVQTGSQSGTYELTATRKP